ncbi:MAG: pyruvate formate-lyase-activating protein [Culicoidibacterales bacterium]
MEGRYHSIESFGNVDGPGTRMVLFLQGCPLRCLYCHNADTWLMKDGNTITTDEVITRFEKNIAFYRKGGITVSGGEPLLQIDFITELFTKLQAKGVHTCIDTSGAVFQPGNQHQEEKLKQLLAVTDLLLIDIKHIDSAKNKILTGQPNEHMLSFIRFVDMQKVPFWIRHVLVPGYSDDQEDLYQLGKFIGDLNYAKVLEVLPYHRMGANKWDMMGMEYPLETVIEPSKESVMEAKQLIFKGIAERQAERRAAQKN